MKQSVRTIIALYLAAAIMASLCGCAQRKEEESASVEPGESVQASDAQVNAAQLGAAVDGLNSQEPGARESAAYALARMGEGAGSAVPSLVELFNNDNSNEVRIAALRALSRIAPSAAEFKSVLVNAFTDENDDVRIAGMEIMAGFFPPYSVLSGLTSNIRGRQPGDFAKGDSMPRFDYEDELVPLMREALADDNREVRILASKVLAGIGFIPLKRWVLPALIEALDDPANYIWAINAIGQLGPEAIDAMPKLIEIHEEALPGPGVDEILSTVEPGADILEVLRENWPDSALLRVLEKGAPDRVILSGETSGLLKLQWENGWEETTSIWDMRNTPRALAAKALGEMRSDEVVQALLEDLEDDDSYVKGAAALSLGKLGEGADVTVPLVIEMLKSDPFVEMDYALRYDLFEALRHFGPAARGAVPGLIDLFDYEYNFARTDAIETLGAIGRGAAGALPMLQEILDGYVAADPGEGYRDEEAHTPILAAEAILKIEAPSRAGMEYFARKLAHENPLMRAGAVMVLKDFWPESFLPIAGALEDAESIVSDTARSAIYAQESIMRNETNLVPYIVKALDSGRDQLQLAALGCIDDQGVTPEITDEWKAEADVLVPAIVRAIEDIDPDELEASGTTEDSWTRIAVARRCVAVLKKFEPDASDVVPALTRLLCVKGEESQQRDVLVFLGGYGPAAAFAVPKLTDMLVPGYTMRAMAAWTLGEIGPAAADAVPALIDALSDDNSGVRWNAATALGLIGYESNDVLAALYKVAFTDNNGEVRRAAKGAIERIEGAGDEDVG